MAVIKKTKAIKNYPKHLLGIQNLSFSEAKEILKQAKENELFFCNLRKTQKRRI